MKVLVSGGTGFLGQAITKALLKKGHTVRVLGRDLPKIKAIFLNEVVEAVEGDITAPESLIGTVDGIDMVVQCAQFPGHPVENRRKGFTYWKIDALGTENLAKAAKAAKVKHFLYLSGAGTDNKKREPWFKAKWYAEQAVHGSGLPATILRCSWVYGPGDKSLNKILAQTRHLPFFPLIGDGNNHVQPIFIDDLAQIVAACVENAGEEDRLFEVGGPQELKMKTMMKIVLKVTGKKKMILPIPKALVKLGAWFLQFLPNPPMNPRAVDFVTMDVSIDTTPLRKAFPNIKLKTLEEGLGSYLSLVPGTTLTS